MLGQELRRFLTDMAYSEREQQTRKVVLLLALYGLNKIICRLLLMSLESCYFACRYVIYIGYIRYQTLRDKLFDECIASISIASREQKWITFLRSCAGHSGLTQRTAASPSSRITGAEQDGQIDGKT